MPAKILLIEDDAIIAEDIQATLTESGHSVLSGYPDIFNADEEFPDNIDRLIADSGVSLILMDINLSSQLDGVDLVKHIQRKSDIPVIYITGASQADTVRRARDTEPYAYLVKPFSPVQLRSQVEMTLRLYESKRKKKAAEDEKNGIWYLDIGQTGIRSSFSWLAPFGFPANRITSERDFLHIIHPEDVESVKAAFVILGRKLKAKGAFEYRVVDKHGQARWILSKIIDARKKAEGEFSYTILSLDVTPQKRREEILVYDSSHDNLTGLLNRKSFLRNLNRLLKGASAAEKNFAVIFSDLDNFKQVNDEYGHEVGDELLKKVALQFQHTIKKKDTIARFGGDEFAFIVRDLKKPGDIHYVAQRIIDSIVEPICVGSALIKTSVSLGVVMPGTISDDAKSLLRHADAAMYKAKKDRNKRYWLYSQNPHPPVQDLQAH